VRCIGCPRERRCPEARWAAAGAVSQAPSATTPTCPKANPSCAGVPATEWHTIHRDPQQDLERRRAAGRRQPDAGVLGCGWRLRSACVFLQSASRAVPEHRHPAYSIQDPKSAGITHVVVGEGGLASLPPQLHPEGARPATSGAGRRPSAASSSQQPQRRYVNEHWIARCLAKQQLLPVEEYPPPDPTADVPTPTAGGSELEAQAVAVG